MKVEFAPPVELRLAQILTDLVRRGVVTQRFQAKLDAKLAHAFRFPKLGRPVPELAGSGFREFTVEPYRFFYCFTEESGTLWIVAIWRQRERVTNEPWHPVP